MWPPAGERKRACWGAHGAEGPEGQGREPAMQIDQPTLAAGEIVNIIFLFFVKYVFIDTVIVKGASWP